MNRHLYQLLILSLVSLLSAFHAYAEQPQLSSEAIKNWMDSQRSLEAWGKQHEAILSGESSTQSTPQTSLEMSIESLLAPLKEKGLYDKANQVIRKHGFASMEEWAAITLRITTAAAALEFEENPEIMDTTELEELAKSSKISPEQKQAIIQAIISNQTMVKQILSAANPADKQALKPHLKDLMLLMNEPY